MRETQERLTSSPLYKPSRDITPAPTDTDNTYLMDQRKNISDILNQTSIKDIALDSGYNTEMQNMRKRNLPVFKKKTVNAQGKAIKQV